MNITPELIGIGVLLIGQILTFAKLCDIEKNQKK